MTTNRLDQIEARAKAATDGPWKLWAMDVLADPVGNSNLDDAIDVASTHMLIDGKPRTFDAEFIAHARADVPDLVAFVRDVEARHAARSNGARNGWLGEPFTDCAGCGKPWPCPDRQALDRLNGATR